MPNPRGHKPPPDVDELRDLVTLALPYIEEAATDPVNKPEPVRALARRMRRAIDNETG